jgi:hypothetical protein
MAWQPDYIALSDLKSFVGGGIAGTSDDVVLAAAITAASRAVDNHCGRQFGKVDFQTARIYEQPSGCYTFVIDDLMDTNDITVSTDLADDQTYATAITDFRFYPLNALADGEPYTKLRIGDGVSCGPLRIFAWWGWQDVPADVKYATLLQASRFFFRKDAAFGILGSPEMGSELRLLAKVDADVAVLLSGRRRMWGSV